MKWNDFHSAGGDFWRRADGDPIAALPTNAKTVGLIFTFDFFFLGF